MRCGTQRGRSWRCRPCREPGLRAPARKRTSEGPADEPALGQGRAKVSHRCWRDSVPAGSPHAPPAGRQGACSKGDWSEANRWPCLGQGGGCRGHPEPATVPVTAAGLGWGLSTCPLEKARTQPPPDQLLPPEPDGMRPRDQVRAVLPLSAPRSLIGGRGTLAFSWRTREEGIAVRPGAQLPAELTERPATVTPESVLRPQAVLRPTAVASCLNPPLEEVKRGRPSSVGAD